MQSSKNKKLLKREQSGFYGIVVVWVDILLFVLILVVGALSVLYFRLVLQLRQVIGEIAETLIFYANQYCNSGTGTKKAMDEASENIRKKASLLRSRARLIRGYRLFSLLRILPRRSNVEEASGELIYLSNSIHRGNPTKNYERSERIKELLNLK